MRLKVWFRIVALLGLISVVGQIPSAQADDLSPVVVASKSFTESRILAEMMAQLIEAHTDIPVERKMGLGGTLVCLTALQNGEIDVYPEYTGTGWSVVLKEPGKSTDSLRTFLHVRAKFRDRFELDWLMPFGFNNSFAMAMRTDRAEALGATRYSDLRAHAKNLKAGVGLEFINREDGYPGLEKTYGFSLGEVRGMEHALAYEALLSGEIDLMDVYTTDGKIARYPITVLEDDRRFFPPYDGAPLIRTKTLERYPELRPVIERLAFQIDDVTMRRINDEVETGGKRFAAAAKDFLVTKRMLSAGAQPSKAETVRRDEQTFFNLLIQRRRDTLLSTLQHIFLTFVAVFLAIGFAVPLGIFIYRKTRFRTAALGIAGVIQTIPSLALLAFMIPIPGLGLGINAAIAALFLYALLPILRNTYTGITEVDPDLIDSARGMGLTERQLLWHIQLPLAARTIMAGIRTSTVISVGVATLAAFIGAGGLGEPIVTGLQLNDINLILTGAVPAALLAILVDFSLAGLERRVVPKGLRLDR